MVEHNGYDWGQQVQVAQVEYLAESSGDFGLDSCVLWEAM